MKNGLLTCAVVLGLATMASADEPNPETAEVRQEIVELRKLLKAISNRLERLEERVVAEDNERNELLPWQIEQPYLWDGSQPVRPSDRFRLPSPF